MMSKTTSTWSRFIQLPRQEYMRNRTMALDELDRFLAKPHIARLATIYPNGKPHVVPIWFLAEEGAIFMSTGADSVKVRNLRKNSQVAVTIDTWDGDFKLKGVVIEGKAELITDGVKEIARKILIKYIGEQGLNSPPARERLSWPLIVIKINPEKILSWDQTR